ncbi:NAD-dependent protein deacylase [Pseudomonas syringae]|uniref:SIR2 family NAD-dependent protein deacylase n=1 Tax=Pseudomonas syringae TaxID=317 RepID=UPI001F2CF7D8|nr:NAD-dependent deacylase [Pseudomonas syringae]MCF5182961.1 NAD-dependent protein deacylase [Pseudomonas syringae]MCF5316385.1 NAD-dependent protein deacylase [Pseudomonas syringae]MCF5364684.1 NAD-dependent protein deacylase [Pseudomonas syringae]MCF5392252.1 NAD-dependent protein deacylase [Pseudomonas syringae]MCF5398054.1 NAD-dependent protein deacylase [Pseudomonas syringae]
MASTIEAVAELVAGAKRIVVFTGAGISADSGIPTFRDPLTGIWAQYDPEKLETANAFRKDAALVWGWYLWRRAQVAQASPNAAHLAVVQLAQSGREVTVVTQNIDDLHERAGSTGVIHLHGALAVPKCFACHRIPASVSFDQQFFSDGLSVEPPRCPRCNGKLRPGVVWFGEDLPIAVWKRAVEAAQGCDVLLSIGTSGVVFPAAEIPRIALKSGARVVHINTTETPLESPLEMSLIGRAAACVPAIVSQIAAPGKVV